MQDCNVNQMHQELMGEKKKLTTRAVIDHVYNATLCHFIKNLSI